MANDQPGRKRKFATSMPFEATELEWEIKNLPSIIRLDKELKSVKLEFYAGDEIGLPTKWRLFFKISEAGRVGIFLELLKSPEGGKPVFAEFGYYDWRAEFNGCGVYFPGKRIHNYYKESTWGFENVFYSVSELLLEPSCQGEILKMKFTFTLYKNIELTSSDENAPKMAKLDKTFRLEVLKDLDKMLESGVGADVKIQTADGKELKAHKLILGARSPVFMAMFNAEMTESSSGVVSIPDLSYEAMRIALKFIYTGKMEDTWEEVMEEVVRAADKYSLTLMKEYCDRMLASTCTPANAWSRLKLAKLHRLTRAENEIAEYIKGNIGEMLVVETLEK